MVRFDPGPPAQIAEHFARLPSFAEHRDWFGTTGGQSSTAAGWTVRLDC
jgi:hypothetical protein